MTKQILALAAILTMVGLAACGGVTGATPTPTLASKLDVTITFYDSTGKAVSYTNDIVHMLANKGGSYQVWFTKDVTFEGTVTDWWHTYHVSAGVLGSERMWGAGDVSAGSYKLTVDISNPRLHQEVTVVFD